MLESVRKIKSQVFPLFSPSVRNIIEQLPQDIVTKMEEIRLRHEKPLSIHWSGGEAFLNCKGELALAKDSYFPDKEDLQKTIELISGYSLYAHEEEVRQGYLTVPGGHRVGLAGKAVMEGKNIKCIRDISSLNFRIARQVKGAGEKILPFLIDRRRGCVLHSLIISPPQAGKTTLLRDLARLISTGGGVLGLSGQKVGIIDERSEIAGCFQGMPQLDIGERSDVLDACPKAEGIMLMLRALSPQVLITDEIGNEQDVNAVKEAVYCGVTVITSAHGSNLEEICNRPILGKLIQGNYFERLIFLSSSKGPGTLEIILEGERGLPLYTPRGGGSND